MIIVAGGVLLLLSVIGFSPVPPLRFEARCVPLEPKNSRAAEALQAIMAKMPTRWEPVLAIVHARDAQELHDDLERITAHLDRLQQAGKIKGFSTRRRCAFLRFGWKKIGNTSNSESSGGTADSGET